MFVPTPENTPANSDEFEQTDNALIIKWVNAEIDLMIESEEQRTVDNNDKQRWADRLTEATLIGDREAASYAVRWWRVFRESED